MCHNGTKTVLFRDWTVALRGVFRCITSVRVRVRVRVYYLWPRNPPSSFDNRNPQNSVVYRSSYPPRGNFQPTALDRRRLILKPVPSAVSPWAILLPDHHHGYYRACARAVAQCRDNDRLKKNQKLNSNTKSNPSELASERARAQCIFVNYQVFFFVGTFSTVQISTDDRAR